MENKPIKTEAILGIRSISVLSNTHSGVESRVVLNTT